MGAALLALAALQSTVDFTPTQRAAVMRHAVDGGKHLRRCKK